MDAVAKKVSNVAMWAHKPLEQTGVIVADTYLKTLFAADHI